jgi:hypothetical protein
MLGNVRIGVKAVSHEVCSAEQPHFLPSSVAVTFGEGDWPRNVGLGSRPVNREISPYGQDCHHGRIRCAKPEFNGSFGRTFYAL